MRVVIQRVGKASVRVDGELVGSISKGLLVFLGITHDDQLEDVSWLVKKTLGLRIFSDTNDVMNCSVQDVDGDVLIVSQFFFASTAQPSASPPARRLIAEAHNPPNVAPRIAANERGAQCDEEKKA